MPLIPPFIFQDLANMLAAVEGTDAAAPVHNGKRGHPVLFHRRHLAALQSLSGDEGARSILKTPGFHMAEQRVQDAGVLIDLDRLEHRSDIEQRVKQVFGI
jgi:molybdenum cofactor cytidylyltransferase